MADAVTSQTIVDTDKRAVIKLTNSGITGDIDLTTHGHTNHDHYTIVLELRKSY
jgi:hypothetical protein